MFRKKNKKKKDTRKKITETLTVNGYDVVIHSNIPIDKEGVKTQIAEYATSAAHCEEELDVIAALVNIDFFKGMVKVIIEKIDKETLFIKIFKKDKKKK